MKWTNAKVNKLTREECITLIGKANNTTIAYTSASINELRNQVKYLIIQGLI